MTVAYWVLAALLGASTCSQAEEVARARSSSRHDGWVDRTRCGVRVIGVVEVACWRPDPAARDRCRSCPGVGAAIGFVILQILASGVHLSEERKKEVSLNVALIALAG